MSTVTTADLGLPDDPPVPAADAPPVAHVRAKLDAQLRKLLAHEAGTREGSDPEELHQMRVALRRMRSVLKNSGDLLGPRADRLRDELRWLGGALGEVRDYDVLIADLRDTVVEFDERDQDAAERLIAGFVAERAPLKRRLNRKFGSARYRKLLHALAELTTGDSGDVRVPAGRATSVRKPRKKLREAAEALPDEPADDELHALRVRGKRLRYTAEFARQGAGKQQAKKIKTLVGAAKKLQDILGEHQDAVVSAQRMRELAAGTDDGEVGFLAGRIAERELRRRAEARRKWPKALARVEAAANRVK